MIKMAVINENWVFVETDLQKINPVTYQLLTKMKQISHDPVVAVLIEKSDASLETELAEYGPDKILLIKDDELVDGDDLELTDALNKLIQKQGTPNTFIFPATVVGRSVAPRLQARLRTGLTADCLDLKFEGDLLIQTKPSYGDNIMCEITIPNNHPQMATARPNVFAAEKQTNSNLKVEEIENLDWEKDSKLVIKSQLLPPKTTDDITQAERIVALGRGDKTDAGITVANNLAKKLHATVGVTRPLTDLDQYTVNEQIGQSGQTVAPDLLVNLGVSGAVQYTAGIANAKVVVSVNTDEHAQIFKYSDYYFVGNALEFSRALEAIL